MKDPQPVSISIKTTTILKGIAIVLSLLALYYLRDIVLILLVSVVIASAVEPGTQWFVKRRVPRFLSVLIIYFVIISAVAGLLYLALPALVKDVVGFMNVLPQDVANLNVHTPVASQSPGSRAAIEGLSATESIGQAVQKITTSLSSATGSVLGTLTTVFGGAVSFVLIVVISFYLAVQERGIEEFLKLVIPLRQERYIISLWRRTQHKIGRWMQGQLLLAVIIGVLVFVSLYSLGVEHAFLLALIAAIFEIIPIFGPVLAAVPAIASAFTQGGLTFAFVVAGVYLIVQQIENHIIYPLVVKKVVNIHPLMVIISLLVGAKVGGVLGALLSVPVAVALSEFMDDINKDRIAARERYASEQQ